jgi:transposase
VREFAHEHGVAYATFTGWLREAQRAPARDARFARRFTPEERRAAVEAFLKSERKREDFARLWGCSASSLDKWVRRYKEEGPKGLETRTPPKGRRAHHPRRLPDAVRAQVVRVRQEHPEFGVTRVADELRRFHGIRISDSGVRNILLEAGLAPQSSDRRRRRVLRKKPPRRFERARPGELWQSDITSYVFTLTILNDD